MLKRSYDIALPFALDMANKGRYISAIQGSPLGSLVNYSTPDPKVFQGPVSQDFLNSMGMCLEVQSGEEGSLWGPFYDELVVGLADLVRSQLSYVRQTVRPMVDEFFQQSSDHYESLGHRSPAEGLEIVTEALPEFMTDESFLGMLVDYKGERALAPERPCMNLGIELPEDPISLLEVSNGRMNLAIRAWAQTLHPRVIPDVAATFFGMGVGADFGGPYLFEDILKFNDYERCTYAAVYFLMTCHLLDNPPNAKLNLSKFAYETMVFQHKTYSGTLLVNSIISIGEAAKNDILLAYMDREHSRVGVHEEVYSRWIAANGAPELILGMLVSDQTYFSVSQIDENSETLARHWRYYNTVYVDSLENRVVAAMRDFYISLFSEYAGRMDETETEYDQTQDNRADELIKKAKECIDNASTSELLDLPCMAECLIAGIKFGHTPAEDILSDMRRVGKEDPKADPNEAAFLATVNYLVSYVMTQLRVSQ